MKTLVFNGSPKANGDTKVLIDALCADLSGEVKEISCRDNIAPCNDCRYCWNLPGCSIQDDMQDVYAYLQDCNNIVVASPIWFSSLSGPLLNLASRLQTYFAAKYFRKESVALTRKNGVLILVGGEEGTEKIPAQNALTIMRLMNVHRAGVEKIISMHTDAVPAGQDADALRRCSEVAACLNESYGNLV